jgi:putative oxidoreductase
MNTTTLPLARRAGGLRSLLEASSSLLSALASPFALLTRLYVSWQFLKSGWLKVTSWETTLGLFRDEYHVPLLPPALAAVVGTFGELFFPALLIVGLFGRLSALGLFAVNAMAVISYRHVLLTEGFEAAVGQHVLWGFMLLTLAIYGPGKWSLDQALRGRFGHGAA